MPFFSVVITVYNKANYIKNTLKSVLNQTFTDFEIIIINDGSSDGSLEVINSFTDKRIRTITIENQGASVARNTGIKEAKAQYIALLDGDDLWKEDYLNSINDAIKSHPENKIFATAIAQKYSKKTVPVSYSFKQNNLYGAYNYFEASKKYSILSGSSIVFNKSILNKTGLFDSNIVSGQDVDLWIRFGIHYDIVFINKTLAIYNHIISSLSNTTLCLKSKPKFDKYFKEEKENKPLKAYLDLNRYSMAILSKFVNDSENFKYYLSHIDLKNLNIRQRLLLKSPKWLLKVLLKLKSLKGEKVYYPEN